MDSVPGVGPTLRACMLAWLPELGQLNRGEAGKLVGVAPLPDDRGTIRGVRRIFGGRAPLRKVLYMATMGAMLHNPQLRAFMIAYAPEASCTKSPWWRPCVSSC